MVVLLYRHDLVRVNVPLSALVRLTLILLSMTTLDVGVMVVLRCLIILDIHVELLDLDP